MKQTCRADRTIGLGITSHSRIGFGPCSIQLAPKKGIRGVLNSPFDLMASWGNRVLKSKNASPEETRRNRVPTEAPSGTLQASNFSFREVMTPSGSRPCAMYVDIDDHRCWSRYGRHHYVMATIDFGEQVSYGASEDEHRRFSLWFGSSGFYSTPLICDL